MDLTRIESISSDGSHLNAEQVGAIETYIRQLLTALDLAHWRVAVGRDLPPDGAILMIDPVDGRRFATIDLKADWWDTTTATEKRVDLIHEVLHLAHHDAEAGVRRYFDYSADVSRSTTDLVMGEFKTNLERMVDSLSYVIAPFMPEWVDEPAS